MGSHNRFAVIGNKGRLVDRVVNEIQRSIVDGQLNVGERLPPERELAEQVGVSRTVIREAVHILVARGLLETKQGVGTTVRQMTSEQIAEPLSLLLRTHDVSIDDLHQVRSILEVEIVGLAATHATRADGTRLRQISARMESVAHDPKAFADGDADFHQTLAQMSRNRLLAVLLDSIRDLMQEIRILVCEHPDLYQTVTPDHGRIVERVVANDPQGARRAMRQHLEHARRIQQDVLARTEQG